MERSGRLFGVAAVSVLAIGCGGGSDDSSKPASSGPKADPSAVCALVTAEEVSAALGETFKLAAENKCKSTTVLVGRASGPGVESFFLSAIGARPSAAQISVDTIFRDLDDLRDALKDPQPEDIGDGGFVSSSFNFAGSHLVDFMKDGSHVRVAINDVDGPEEVSLLLELAKLVESKFSIATSSGAPSSTTTSTSSSSTTDAAPASWECAVTDEDVAAALGEPFTRTASRTNLCSFEAPESSRKRFCCGDIRTDTAFTNVEELRVFINDRFFSVIPVDIGDGGFLSPTRTDGRRVDFIKNGIHVELHFLVDASTSAADIEDELIELARLVEPKI